VRCGADNVDSGTARTAQHAVRQGRVVAKNIIAHAEGGIRRQFNFKTIGQLASIGHRAGVASLYGVNISGFFAWWMWRTIYLSKLPRLEKKLRRGARLDTRSSIFERSVPVYRCSIGAPYEQGHSAEPPGSGTWGISAVEVYGGVRFRVIRCDWAAFVIIVRILLPFRP